MELEKHTQELESHKEEIKNKDIAIEHIKEVRDMLQQEVNQLRADLKSKDNEQAKECASIEQQTTPMETVFSKLSLERDAEEKQMQKERLFEARIQNLTEDNDALRKENDLLRRENDLNNGWIDNQQGLMKALEEAGEVQAD